MTKRGQNRLVQITLHVHTHTIGGYGIGVNRLSTGWRVIGTGAARGCFAGNVFICASLPQRVTAPGRNTPLAAVIACG